MRGLLILKLVRIISISQVLLNTQLTSDDVLVQEITKEGLV